MAFYLPAEYAGVHPSMTDNAFARSLFGKQQLTGNKAYSKSLKVSLVNLIYNAVRTKESFHFSSLKYESGKNGRIRRFLIRSRTTSLIFQPWSFHTTIRSKSTHKF